MSFAAPLQTRLLLLVGVVAALGLAAFMLMQGGLVGGDDTTAAPPVTRTPVAAVAKPATGSAVKPTKPARPVKPAVVLDPGLPVNVARALRRERVVVAAVYAPRAGDLNAVAEARAGARASGAGFATLNVLDERTARALEPLAGAISDPSVLIFKRPGTIVNRFDGFADAVTVAQAAQNAGAR